MELTAAQKRWFKDRPGLQPMKDKHGRIRTSYKGMMTGIYISEDGKENAISDNEWLSMIGAKK